jgi:uncharacterized membrane protein YphA (DoxX/SURF4 family)
VIRDALVRATDAGSALGRPLAAAWNRFFHHPEPVVGIALFRVLWGGCLLANWALLAPDLFTWLGDRGVLTRETARALTGPGRLDVFRVLPPGDGWVALVFALTVLASLGLAVGCFTRTSAALTFVGLVSIHHRDPLILHGGDTLLRALTFLLVFAPAGEAWSVDRWWARRRGAATAGPVLRAPWAQRLIQIQLALLYASTVGWKLLGSRWWDGTAVYYLTRLVEFERFPLPSLFDQLWAIRAMTWGSLLIEASLATLVWVPRFRYPVLVAGVGLHLGVEYTMNVPLFEWLMLAGLTTFVPSADVEAWARRLFARRRATLRPAWPGPPLP